MSWFSFMLFHSFDLTWVPCSSSCAFAIWFAMHLLIVCLKLDSMECLEISFSARFTKSTEIGRRRPLPLFSISLIHSYASHATILPFSHWLYPLTPLEITSAQNCISSNSQTVFFIFQHVYLFQRAIDKWALVWRKRLRCMISLIQCRQKPCVRK